MSKKAKSGTGEVSCSAFCTYASALLAAVCDVSVLAICRLVRAVLCLLMTLHQSQYAAESVLLGE